MAVALTIDCGCRTLLGLDVTQDQSAPAILLLASRASARTTGATLGVTGGQHLHGETWVVDPEGGVTVGRGCR